MKSKKISIPKPETMGRIKVHSLKKRVGILGGTFNPPHVGHLIIADQVKTQLGLDFIKFIPNNIPPHVDFKDTISANHRLNMLQLSIIDNPYFLIDNSEVLRGGISYTIDTIKSLIQNYPENEYYLIIGGDMVNYLPKWYQIDQLVKLVKFVGVSRPGYKKNSKYPILWVDSPQLDISSTMIRRKIKQGYSIKYLVKEKVIDYIIQNRLYILEN